MDPLPQYIQSFTQTRGAGSAVPGSNDLEWCHEKRRKKRVVCILRFRVVAGFYTDLRQLGIHLPSLSSLPIGEDSAI